MVSEGIFINGEKVTFNPENILTSDISTYTEQIGEATQDWLDEHLEPGGSVPIDDTLTISGAAADAKKTGDEIDALNDGLADVGDVLHYKNPTIIDGKTVTTTGTTADPTSFNTESGWSCAVDDCKSGEVYTISGHGGAKTRLWCFIDKDNNILAVADIGKTVDDLRLVVPPKAVKIICNFQPSAHTVKLTKIMGVFYTDYELKNRNAAADALRVGEEVGLINDHLSQLRTNEVRGKVDALLGARWSLNHISTDNGQDKNNGYNCRTDNYISVADADGYLHYKMSSPAGIRLFLFFYNSAKEWISHDAGTLHTGTYEGQVALPTGTAYIRFLLSNEDWGMFDTISDATDYFEAWFVPESGEEKKFETIYGARIEEAAQIYEGDAAAARLGYIWISDLHFKKNWADNTTALKRQLKAVARLANRTSVDFVCIGGDIVDSETEADDLFENINYWLSPLAECNKPVIYLIGNHDDNAYGEWIGKLPAKGLFVDRGEYHNDICAPTSDAGYFYFDIDRKGVRVVCLDTIDYESRSGKNGSNWWSLSQSQVEWFCQKALDTPYDIVILSHMTPDYDYNSWHLGNEGGYHSDLISAIAAYNARGTMTLYSKTFDFTEAEGYIKMMHVGHAHFEFEAAKTVGGIPCIFTSCAKQYGQAQQSYETAVTGKDDTYTIASSVAYDTHHQNTTGYEYKRYTTRTLDTISEALFDLVSVKNTRADFYRIGAGEDRQVTLQATNPRQYDDQIAKTREEVDDLKSGISDLKEDLSHKANTDGYYADLVSGGSTQLLSNLEQTDMVPYNYRTAGGSLEIGDREKLKKIVGGSLPVNQLVQNGNFADTAVWNAIGCTLSVNNNIGTITCSTDDSAYLAQSVNIPQGHKFFLHGFMSGSNGARVNQWAFGSSETIKLFTITTSWTEISAIGNKASSNANLNIVRLGTSTGSPAIGETVSAKDVVLHDLTQMFGTTIADYVYSLETATAGAGVAWLKAHFPRIFDSGYIPYNAGTLEHVSGLSAHKMTGFNQFDGELEKASVNWTTYIFTPSSSGGRWASKNYIPVLPNATYYISHPTSNLIVGYTDDSGSNGRALRNNGTNTHIYVMPGDVHYIKFGIDATAEPTNICINLHWDGERDGEYEPYEEHSYPLDSDVTLRGIPKLDANNNLYYDGDEYVADGTVNRRYNIITFDGTQSIENSDYRGEEVNAIVRFNLPSNAKTGENSDSNSAISMCNSLGAASRYMAGSFSSWGSIANIANCYSISTNGQKIAFGFKNSALTDNTKVTAYLTEHPITVVYELATPTTESADPYTEIQNVSNCGTEEFVTTSLVPVGHETAYQPDLRAKIEVAPESPDTDGLYLMKRENGQNSYVAYLGELPSDPTTDGTYTLKCTVASGTATKTWEADT